MNEQMNEQTDEEPEFLLPGSIRAKDIKEGGIFYRQGGKALIKVNGALVPKEWIDSGKPYTTCYCNKDGKYISRVVIE